MLKTEESIVIVHSVAGTPSKLIAEASNAVSSYVRAASSVVSVVAKPVVFPIPPASAPGATLGSELTRQLQDSVGAIVFIDDLRPNVAYELGFFHGQGKVVLVVTNGMVESAWSSISDLAGSALLDLNETSLAEGIHRYLDALYGKLASVKPFPAPAFPSRHRNLISELSLRARIPVTLHESDFGEAIQVGTWGGIIFDAGYNLLPDAKFKLVIRALSAESAYSVYFRVRFCDFSGVRRSIYLGLTSNHSLVGFEANERNIPSQALTKEWRLLTGSFAELMRLGQVLGVQRIEHLELIRVRAGGYQADPFAENPPYEIGYLEIVGIDH